MGLTHDRCLTNFMLRRETGFWLLIVESTPKLNHNDGLPVSFGAFFFCGSPHDKHVYQLSFIDKGK